MNKILLTSALTIASLSPLAAPLARADDGDGGNNGNNGIDTNQLDNFFVSGSLGKSDYRNGFSKDNGVYQNLSAGWRWDNIVGPEIGYAFLGRSRNQSFDGTNTRLKPQAGLVGLNAKYDFYGNWFVTAHAGYLRSRSKASDRLDGVRLNGDTSYDNGWYGGAGVGYDITSNVSVGINYDNYHVKYHLDGGAKSNIAAYSATVQYRF